MVSNEEKDYLVYLTNRELKGATYNCTNAIKNENLPVEQMENILKKLTAKQQIVKIISYVMENDLLDTILED